MVGREFGKVRRLLPGPGGGAPSKAAGPSAAVRIVGLKGLPAAGARLVVCADEAKARNISRLREAAWQVSGGRRGGERRPSWW